MSIELSREELYERVWSEPMQKLSKQFGLSDVGLAKTCRRWDIPVPPRGYWAKLQAGKRVKKTPLSPEPAGSLAGKLSFSGPTKAVVAPPKPAEPPHPLIAAEAEPASAIEVPETIQVRHPLLKSMREVWQQMDNGNFHWNSPTPHFILAVSKATRRRALCLLEILFRALEARGHALKIGQDHKLFAVVLGENCELLLRERQRQARTLASREKTAAQRSRPYDLVFAEEFELRIERRFGRDTFRDKAGRPLEQQLNDVVVALLRAAFAEKNHRTAQERARLAQAERDRRRQIEESRRREEKARIKRLNKWFEAAERHRRLVAFTEELRQAIGPVDESSELGQWLEWIDEYVGESDILERFRERQPTITVYHCASTYAADRLLKDGFEARGPSYGEDQEMPASVIVTDVPMEGIHGGTICIVVDLPEDVALPYEKLLPDQQYREFMLPAEILNRFPRRLDSGEAPED